MGAKVDCTNTPQLYILSNIQIGIEVRCWITSVCQLLLPVMENMAVLPDFLRFYAVLEKVVTHMHNVYVLNVQ